MSTGLDSQHPIPSLGSLEEGRVKSQGTEEKMMQILPLMSSLQHCRLNAHGFDIPRNSHNVAKQPGRALWCP